jgi:hypothetical protein
LHANSTVRKALDRIVAERGLLAESRGRAPLYTVPSSFAGARDAMRRALWPDRDADRAAEPRRLAGGRAAR